MSASERPGALEPEDEEAPASAGMAGQRSSGSPAAADREETVVGGGGCREQELTYELQQGYRILGEFLQEKHRGLTGPFLQPLGGVAGEEEEEAAAADGEAASTEGPRSRAPAAHGLSLLKMEEKFGRGQYGSITEFVADFRSMLETCYRLHGVDHWISRQGQKLEMMLEQKLALLSR